MSTQYQFHTTTVILDNKAEIGKGTIIIADTAWGYNYSHYWDAMGESKMLESFLLGINKEYFIRKLLPADKQSVPDWKKTFTVLRKLIKEDLPWYKYMEFQKEMRESIMQFQKECEGMGSHEGSTQYFYNQFPHYMKNLPYYLIDDRSDREEIESLIDMDEFWHMIQTKGSMEWFFMSQLFDEIQTRLTIDS